MITFLFAALILVYIAYEVSQGRARVSLLCLAVGSFIVAATTALLKAS